MTIQEARNLLKNFEGHTLIETNGNVIRFDDIIEAAKLIAASEQREEI